MYSVKQIAKLGLLKAPDGTTYDSETSVTRIVKMGKHKKVNTKNGLGFLLTEDDIRKLQNLINKRNGIWNTPMTIKSNTSGRSAGKANQQEN